MTVVLAHVPDVAAEAAFAAAVEEALLRSTDLVIVNGASGDVLIDAKLDTEEALDALVTRATQAGVAVRVERPSAADWAHGIIAIAEQTSAKLVVIGVKHRTSVGKMIFGTGAQRVVLEAPCPVLTVKP